MSLIHHPVWKRLRPLPWIGSAVLLALPALAMRFTAEVQWSGVDFLLMGTLLALSCLAIELALRAAPNSAYMLAAGIAVGAGFLLLWVNLAVGVIGNEDEPANRMFFAVLALGVIASLMARLRPRGMAVAMLLMALAQIAASVATAVLGEGHVFVLALVFAAMWLAAAWLFRFSARQPVEG